MGLHRVFTDKEFFGDFPGAQAIRDQGHNLQLPGRDSQPVEALLIGLEGYGRVDYYWDLDLPDYHLFPGLGEPEPEPYPGSGENKGDQGPIYLKRVGYYEIAVLYEGQDGNQGAAKDAVEQNRFLHGVNIGRPSQPFRAPRRLT